MNPEEENKQLRTLIEEASNLVILVSPHAAGDGLYAGLALKDVLASRNKNVNVVYSEQLPVGVDTLPEAKDIKCYLGENALVVSLDNAAAQIEKVAYSPEGQTLNLVLSPVARNFDPLTVKSFIRSQKIDLLIILGAGKLEEFGQFYNDNRQEFENSAILNIDNHNDNSHFGTTDVIDPEAKSLCELVFYKLAQWQWRPTQNAARLLSLGLQ